MRNNIIDLHTHTFPKEIAFHNAERLSREQLLRPVKKLGAEKVLFGSDSPRASQAESVYVISESGLSEKNLDLIFSKNALKLL